MIPAQSRGAACSSDDPFGQSVGELLVGDAAVGVTAVDVPSGESWMRAEVLVAAAAVPAGLVGAGEPGNADPIPDSEAVGARSAGVYFADHLVPGSDLRTAGRQIAFGQMQIGAAHPTTRNAHSDLSGARVSGVPVQSCVSGCSSIGAHCSTTQACTVLPLLLCPAARCCVRPRLCRSEPTARGCIKLG